MTEVNRFSSAEVASNNGRQGAPLWIIYKDSVYDVTKYINEHPGGDVILEEAGKDATAAFNDVGHSSDALAVMAKLKIGELVEEEKKYDANGKKKPKPTKSKSSESEEVESRGGCLSCIFCGLL